MIKAKISIYEKVNLGLYLFKLGAVTVYMKFIQ